MGAYKIMENIKVSIITPCLNSEKTIKRTLESVLGQSYENIEYIIIDGKSSDKTLDIINKYKSAFNNRLTVVSEKDDGIYDAMNKGIGIASGDLIGIVNSDDYYEKDAVMKMVENMSDEKHQILYGYERCVTNGLEDKVVIFNHRNLDMQMITHPTCFVTRSVYNDFGKFDISYRSSADYEFVLRLFHNSDTVFSPIYHIISNFESGGISSTQVGVRETAKLRYRYHIISKHRYIFLIIRSYLYDLKKSIRRFHES